MKKEKISFEQFYQNLYPGRWEDLKQALRQPATQVVRTTFPTDSMNRPNLSEDHLYGHKAYGDDNKGIFTLTGEDGLKSNYVMDPASIICANQLEVAPGDFVLDMCSAPGGKALILIEKLGSEGEIWCNEISQNRRQRLKQVIQDYCPKEIRPLVHLKGKDGIKYGIQFPETFDRVLLDAPCSGERHLLHSPTELEKWNINRTKRLAKLQYGLLCSAILATKAQGQIVYSTCSISNLENDGVIGRVLEKKSDQIRLDLPELHIEGIERTKFGYIFLPDKSKIGPIYFSRLKKL